MSPSTTRPVPDIQTILSRFGEDFAICTRRLERCRKKQELAQTMVLKFRKAIESVRLSDFHTTGKEYNALTVRDLCAEIDREGSSEVQDGHRIAWLAGLKKSLVPPTVPDNERQDYLSMTCRRAAAYLKHKAAERENEHVRLAKDLDVEGHPFERVIVPWIVTKTGFTEAELRKAGRLGFGGHQALVDRLQRLDRDDDTSRLWEILADKEYQRVFQRIGLENERPKGRNASSKAQSRIEKAIRDLPAGTARKAVAGKAELGIVPVNHGVEPAEDGMVLSSTLAWPDEYSNYRKRREFLESHNDKIPNELRGRHRYVDAAAFVRFFSKRSRDAFERLDESDEDLPEIQPALMIAAAQERLLSIRDKKSANKARQ